MPPPPAATASAALAKAHKQELKALSVRISDLLKGKKGKERDLAEVEATRWRNDLASRHAEEDRALEARLEERGGENANADDGVDDAAAAPPTDEELKRARNFEKKKKKLEAKAAEEARARKEEEERRAKAGPTPRDVEFDLINKHIAAMGLKIKEIPPDGDCLFGSVRDQLEVQAGPAMSVEGLRILATNTMRDNPALFTPFLPEGDSLGTYMARMLRKAEWGGELELRALAMGLGRVIHVHRARGPVLVMGEDAGGEEDLPPLHLTFHEHQFSLGEHYNSAVPLDYEVADDGDGMVEEE